MNRAIALMLFLLFSGVTLGQSFNTEISEIEVTDSVTQRAFLDLIQLIEQENQSFKNDKGYLAVTISNSIVNGNEISKGQRVDTVMHINATVSYAHPDRDKNEFKDFYPSQYFFVENRLFAVFQDYINGKATQKSRRKYFKKLNSYLDLGNSSRLKEIADLNHIYDIYFLQDRVRDTKPHYIIVKQNVSNP